MLEFNLSDITLLRKAVRVWMSYEKAQINYNKNGVSQQRLDTLVAMTKVQMKLDSIHSSYGQPQIEETEQNENIVCIN